MGGAGAEAGHHLVPLSNLLLDDVAGVGVGGMKLVECPQVALAAGLFAGYQVMVDEVGSEHFLYGVQVALSVGFQKAADQGLVLLYRHASLLLANLTSSFGSATTSMMPPGEVRRIDRILIHPSVWKGFLRTSHCLHPRKFCLIPVLCGRFSKTLSENYSMKLERRRISPRMGLSTVTVLKGDTPYEQGYHV